MEQLKLFDQEPDRKDVAAYASYWCAKHAETTGHRLYRLSEIIDFLRENPNRLLRIDKYDLLSTYYK